MASWPRGSFAENLATDQQGAVFVSLHSQNRIERYDPLTRGVETFCELPAPVTGLAFASDGTLWASGGTVFKTPGYVWRINAKGIAEQWVQIPDAAFPNGCAWLPDQRTLLICESITGRTLAINRIERRFALWTAEEQLQPVNKQMPGANGIKYRAGCVYVSVTDRNKIVKIAVHADNSAGPSKWWRKICRPTTSHSGHQALCISRLIRHTRFCVLLQKVIGSR